jgi:hypothetical protein
MPVAQGNANPPGSTLSMIAKPELTKPTTFGLAPPVANENRNGRLRNSWVAAVVDFRCRPD